MVLYGIIFVKLRLVLKIVMSGVMMLCGTGVMIDGCMLCVIGCAHRLQRVL